jgi:hypothetical protein
LLLASAGRYSVRAYANPTVRLSVLALITTALVVACERVPLTSPTGSSISVSIDQTTLPVNGQATVRAIVIESGGTPVHNGTQVSFTTVLGAFTPPEATTVNGVATTIFQAGGISGTTRINAYSGGASTGSGNSSGGGVEVKIGAAAAGSVSLQVVPPTVGQNGGTVTATALVLDPSGNPLRGVPVLFSTDTGTLSNANVISNDSGYAVTNLVTTRAATITARVGTATPATFNVAINAAATVTIETTSTTFIVNQPIAFRITPSAASNASPISLVVVDMGDGTTRTFNNITGPTGFTHTYRNAGGYTVTATSTDINGGRGVSSLSVVVAFETLPTVTMTVAPNPVTLAPGAGSTLGVATFTVNATAGAGGPPIRSVRITLGDGTVIYNGTGNGSSTYKFTAAGVYSATATVTDAGGNVGTTTTVITVQ